MNKIYGISMLLFLFLNTSFAQIEKIKDFDKDGIKDTLRTDTNDYLSVRYTDGSNQKTYDFKEVEFSKSEFLSFVSVPNELMQAENKILLDSLKEYLFPYTKFSKPVPSLEWLLQAYQSNKKIEGGYFSQFMKIPLKWYDWYPDQPPVILVKVKTDTLDLPKHYFYSEKIPEYGFLFYYGHNHLNHLHDNPWFETEYKNNKFEILKTKHGLMIKQNNKYAWIFHTNGSLTRGPSKLRWKSIEKMLIHKHYVFLHHISPIMGTNRVFIINTKNGNVGKLNIENDFSDNSSSCFKMRINKKHFILESLAGGNCRRFATEGETLEFKLKTLFKSLKKLDKK